MKIDDICLIIGTQKGGTTSLFNYLSQHPQIAASRIKEVDFFYRDSIWEKGIDYYESLWNWEPQTHRIALEASPGYTQSFAIVEKVIQRVKTLDANFKFIYILRSPIPKIQSMRKQGFYQGWYAKWLAQETPDTVPTRVLEQTSYATIIRHFEQAFSSDNILLLKTEDLRKTDDANALMKKTCQFLEIDDTFEFSLSKVHNAQNSYRQDTFWHFLREAQYLTPLKTLIPDGIKNNARRLLSKPIGNKKKTLPPLTATQKQFILDALKDDMRQLEVTYNLDVSDWTNAIA
ncbi:MAG: sulfotransferase domain-containing protein [Leptolyngbyaceae cyanobacterium MAG.088]|nr:sulfotransferase domain-containing protein [Leptolyngbyaceae cyanobacterium MAG.088]